MKRIRLLALACGVILYSSLSLSAEDDPRLKEILESWKTAPENLKSCRLRGKCFVYDSVFLVEKRSEVEIVWEKSGRLILRYNKSDIPTKTLSTKQTPEGKQYQLWSYTPETWFWPHEQEVIQILTEQKTACRHDLRKRTSISVFHPDCYTACGFGRELTNFPVHPSFSIFTPQYEWNIKQTEDETYVLAGLPKNRSVDLIDVELIVQKSDYSILAAKWSNQSRTTQTVYTFESREVNLSPEQLREAFDINEDRLTFLELHSQLKPEPPSEDEELILEEEVEPNPLYRIIEFILP